MISQRPSSVHLVTALAVVLNLAQVAEARTCRDRYGRLYRCSGLSRAARIGLGIAIAIGCLILLMILFAVTRLRRRRANQAYVTTAPAPQMTHHTQPPFSGGAHTHNGPQNGTYNPNGAAPAPQYPQQTYQPENHYAPPTGPPPTQEPGHGAKYAPPAGPPPV